MGRPLQESLYALLLVACLVAAILASAAFLAPELFPEPYATAAAESDIWIVATASLTLLGAMVLLLVFRAVL